MTVPSRYLRVLLVCAAVVIAVIFLAPRPAAAQVTVNQTTCSGPCLTNGALQTLTIVCSTTSINNALAQITDRNGPNVINVSGSCPAQFTNINGFNRLTIQGNPGASLGNFNVSNSQNILLKSLQVGGGAPNGLNMIDAGVTLDGVTVQAVPRGINADLGSSLVFSGAPSIVNGNGDGILVGGGSTAVIRNVTISNSNGRGLQVENYSYVTLSNNINGAAAPVNIFGNARGAVSIQQSNFEVRTDGTALMDIHNNGGVGDDPGGVSAEFSSVSLAGHVLIHDNTTPPSPFFPGTPQVVAFGSFVDIGAGAVIQGGVAGILRSTIAFFDDGGSLPTITGGVALGQFSSAMVGGGNSFDTFTCDPTSWRVELGGPSTYGTNNCPLDVPTGMTGPQGIPGPPGSPGIQGVKGDKGDTGAPGVATTETWNSFVAGPLTAWKFVGIITPDNPIQIRRIQATAQTPAVACTANILLLGAPTLPLTAQFADSGSLSVPYVAGSPIFLLAGPGAGGCTTPPANVNVVVQYRGAP